MRDADEDSIWKSEGGVREGGEGEEGRQTVGEVSVAAHLGGFDVGFGRTLSSREMVEERGLLDVGLGCGVI